MGFQTPRTKGLKRTEHVWDKQGVLWKCVLCGAITRKTPPDTPTPEGWEPDMYDKLCDAERKLCPPVELKPGNASS